MLHHVVMSFRCAIFHYSLELLPSKLVKIIKAKTTNKSVQRSICKIYFVGAGGRICHSISALTCCCIAPFSATSFPSLAFLQIFSTTSLIYWLTYLAVLINVWRCNNNDQSHYSHSTLRYRLEYCVDCFTEHYSTFKMSKHSGTIIVYKS